MGKDPAFLFYPGDWLGGTITFNRSHKGAYMDLLMAQFNNGHMSIEDVKIVLGEDFNLMWKNKLKAKFIQDESGNFFNEKLEFEINRRKRFTESRKKNLSKETTHKGTHMKPRMENGNENENINKNTPLKKSEKTLYEKPIEFPFDSENFLLHWNIWKYYKKTEHKFRYKSSLSEQGALNKLTKLADQDEETAIEIIIESISNGWKGFFNLDNNGKSKTGVTNSELFEVFKRKFAKERKREI